jgi:hypothetical protein
MGTPTLHVWPKPHEKQEAAPWPVTFASADTTWNKMVFFYFP